MIYMSAALNFSGAICLSIIFAIPFGIAIGWYKRFAYICDPFVNAMNATPRVALLPLVIIWLGIGIFPRSASSSWALFFHFDQHPRRRKDHPCQSPYRR